jgi:pyruvate dehydrogenase E1 component alpha subunit
MGTAVARASAVSEIRQKAEGYCISSDCLDGMNVLTVRDKALETFDFIRGGNGPYFLEIETYRFRGHSMGDPERYRKPEEIKKWQEHDPIGIYHKHLTSKRKEDESQIATEAELQAIEQLVDKEVEEAVTFAKNSPEPPPEALFEDVYVENSVVVPE